MKSGAWQKEHQGKNHWLLKSKKDKDKQTDIQLYNFTATEPLHSLITSIELLKSKTSQITLSNAWPL